MRKQSWWWSQKKGLQSCKPRSSRSKKSDRIVTLWLLQTNKIRPKEMPTKTSFLKTNWTWLSAIRQSISIYSLSCWISVCLTLHKQCGSWWCKSQSTKSCSTACGHLRKSQRIEHSKLISFWWSIRSMDGSRLLTRTLHIKCCILYKSSTRSSASIIKYSLILRCRRGSSGDRSSLN